jgi:dipeptidyl aminopeptidase/acylaminoacyl peptidase
MPPPLLVYCHDGLAGRVSTAFNGEVQALADMGFAVAQVNYRGSTGFGRNFRDAILAGLDKIPVEDIRATVAWIAAQHQIDRKRVALLGRGFGGFLALRAVQQFPAEFRCAITIDAPTNLADWLLVDETAANERRRQLLGADRDRLEAASPVKHVKPDDKPVFLIQNPNGTDVRRAHATEMRSALDREKVPCEYLEITDEFSRGLPGAKLKVYSAIEEFLNYYVYDWRVKIGDVKKLE